MYLYFAYEKIKACEPKLSEDRELTYEAYKILTQSLYSKGLLNS